MKTALCAGEALIDWISQDVGKSMAEARRFVKASGGAPLNLAVGLARLGIPSGFAGALSCDLFGDELLALMKREGLDLQGIKRVEGFPTRMAYVTLDEQGDRHLAGFSEGLPADSQLDDVPLPENLGCFCFGTLELKHPAPYRAILTAAKQAPLVAFDPNIRLTLWEDPAQLLGIIQEGLKLADLVKVSEEELSWILGPGSLEELAQRLFQEYDLLALAVTCGSKGAYFVTPTAQGWSPGYEVGCVDSTGAGDAFMAGWVSEVLRQGLDRESLQSSQVDWPGIFCVANAVGAIAVTRPGAIEALPDRIQLGDFLRMRTKPLLHSSEE